MIYATRRWSVAMLIVFLLLITGLACVGSLRAQLKKEEVDFEVLATVTAMPGMDCCLWNMAAKHYGDPYKWTVLKDVNRISNERRISKGTVIYIPVLPIKKVGEPEKPGEPSELELLNRKLEAKNKEVNNLKKKNKELAKALQDCKKRVKKMADQAKALKKCRDESKKLKNRLKKLQGENRKLAKANKDKDATIDEFEGRLREMEGALRRCEEELEMAMAKKNRHIEELESELHKCRRELEEIQSAQMAKKHKHMKPEVRCKKEPPHLGKKEYKKDDRALVAAVAIAIVGSLIWIGSN